MSDEGSNQYQLIGNRKMADKFTKEERSALMARIRGKDTKPELLVRRYLHGRGLRFRLHAKALPGKPDIVLRRFRTVVLVHGCFWHGHRECPSFSLPRSRTEFWRAKIAANRSRDTFNSFRLARLGWRVLSVWECKLKPQCRQATLEELYSRLLDDYSGPAKPKRHRPATFRKTIRFVPGTDATAREEQIRRIVKETEQPVSGIALLKKGFRSVPYGKADPAQADGVRICFAAAPDGNEAVPGTIGCIGCGQVLEAYVWNAQDGRCEQCWAMAA